MSKQGTRYDEEFKRTLVDLYHNGKTQASLIKEYGVSQPRSHAGLNNTPQLKRKMVTFLLLNKLKNSKNAMPSSKRKT